MNDFHLMYIFLRLKKMKQLSAWVVLSNPLMIIIYRPLKSLKCISNYYPVFCQSLFWSRSVLIVFVVGLCFLIKCKFCQQYLYCLPAFTASCKYIVVNIEYTLKVWSGPKLKINGLNYNGNCSEQGLQTIIWNNYNSYAISIQYFPI